ncbi:hypothetical protein PO124_00890 [Bacillus licheniformis]|nr:hypothetical protein [Bacillus licheniformis]
MKSAEVRCPKGADAVMFALKRELPVHPGVLDSIMAVKAPFRSMSRLRERLI